MPSAASGAAASLRRVVVPDSPMPEVTAVSRRHHGQLRVAVRDAFQLQQFCAAPRPYEVAMGLGIIPLRWRRKPPLGECGVDLEDQLDVGTLDEVEDRPAALLLDAKHVVEGGIETQRSHSVQ